MPTPDRAAIASALATAAAIMAVMVVLAGAITDASAWQPGAGMEAGITSHN
jgi:hypothetical protein